MTDNFHTVQADMIFYYCDAAAILGLRSGYSSFIARMQGSNTNANDMDPMLHIQWSKVSRYRRIDKILHNLPTQTKRVLDAIYNPEYPWNHIKRAGETPHPLIKVYGKHAACLLFTSHIILNDDEQQPMRRLLVLVNRKLHKTLTPEEQKLSFILGQEAKQLYLQAHQAYLEAAKKVPYK